MNTLKVGDKLPEFTVKDQEEKEVKSTDFKEKKLIVFFYPKASTPGCTAEACSLRDHYQQLSDLGFALLGVSADNVKRQKNFAEKYDFPFPLLADEERQVIDGFGVWGEKKFMGKVYDGIHRKTFLFDENGAVTHVIDKVKTKEAAEQILELLNSEK